MTVHPPHESHPQEPQHQGGVTPPVPTPGAGAPQTREAPTGAGSATGAAGSASPQGSSQGKSQVAKDEAAHVSDTAKEQAGNVADAAKSAGRSVADTAKGEARQVVGEAKQQASQLLDQTMHEVRDQARVQQSRAADGMRTFGDDLHGMTADTQGSLASQLVGEVAQRATAAAGWLEQREPAELVDEVKSFARRRPGTFIAIAAVAGLLVGRLARGLVGDAKDEREREHREDDLSGDSGAAGADPAFGTRSPATPVDNEPWLGERPAADAPGAASPLPSSGPSVNGYPPSRGQSGL